MKDAIRRLTTLGLAGMVLVALFCLLARVFWGFELFTHYSTFWATDALLLVLIFAVLQCPRRAVLALCLAAFFSWRFIPYHFGKPEPPSGEPLAKVMHFNILHSNRSFEEVRDYLVEQAPDIVVLQEFNGTWDRELRDFIVGYPHQFLRPEQGAMGMALLSRFPLEGATWAPINPGGWPVISALVKTPSGDLDLLAIHPPPPVRQRSATARNGCLAAVSDHEANAAARLVIGDFNCSPWSPHFRDLVGAADLRDSSLGRGRSPTWDLFPGLAIPIDHVLHSEEVKIFSREVGPRLGSDHRAVVVEIGL